MNNLLILLLFGAESLTQRFEIPRAPYAVTVTNSPGPEVVKCRMWTEWRMETNDGPRVCMEKFDKVSEWSGLTNITWTYGYMATNYGWNNECRREHLDTHEEVKYVSSNLMAFIVWRGKTNSNYLESIPVTNIVHKWHEEKHKVYTQ